MSTDLREHLDRLDAALAAATPGPWEHIVDDHGRKGIEHSIWSSEEGGIDGSYISEQVEDAADAALIVAAVNALPRLLAAVRAVADLADELDEDSRDAMRISADARERGDREVHRINARHGRVAHHAATAIRTALAVLTEGDAR